MNGTDRTYHSGGNQAQLLIHDIRRRFMESVAVVLMSLALIGLPLSLIRAPQTGLHPNHLWHISVAVLILVLFFFRKRLPDRWLLGSILFIFSSLSISAFWQYGLVSAGLYFGAATIFIASMAHGSRGGIVACGFYAICISVMAYLWCGGSLVFPGNVNKYVLLPSVWALHGAAFLITTAVLFVSASGLVRDLTGLVTTIEEQRREIMRRTDELANTNKSLEAAIKDIKTLSGLLPICSNCKKIRDDKGYWQQVEHYVQHHTEATFTHGLCPQCAHELYPEVADAVLNKMDEG